MDRSKQNTLAKLRSTRKRLRKERVRASTRHQVRYTPLRHGFIRILELYPGQEHDPLRCILRQVSLHPRSANSTSSYEAISYVWGDPTRTSPLICNHRETRITTNLSDALRRLRDPHQTRRLWADAICIDQSNLKERAQQVQLMGSIYETATEVLVWLGHDTGGARKAFDLARDIYDLASTNRRDGRIPPLGEVYFDPTRWHSLITGKAAQARWKCLEDLTNRAWFSRVWVIQEIALASRATLFCGTCRLDWRAFITATQWLVYTRSRLSPDSGLNLSMHIALVLGDPNKSDEILMSLLDICRQFDATDARDKVYGLLGHPCLRGFLQKRAPIVPDFTKSVEEVFKDVAMVGLRQDRSLAVLSYVRRKCWAAPENSRLPSFVPRWDEVDSQYRCMFDNQRVFRTATGIEPDFHVSPCGSTLEV